MELLEEDAIITIEKNVSSYHPKKVAKNEKSCASSGTQKPVNTGTSVRKKLQINSCMEKRTNH